MMRRRNPQVPASTHLPHYLITSAFSSSQDIAVQTAADIEKKEGNLIKNNRIALIFGRKMLHNICGTGIPYDANYKVTASLLTPFDPGGHCLVSTKC